MLGRGWGVVRWGMCDGAKAVGTEVPPRPPCPAWGEDKGKKASLYQCRVARSLDFPHPGEWTHEGSGG